MILILGGGLAGSLLAGALQRRGEAVMVIDSGAGGASVAGSGVINPVTGKRLNRSWNLEAFLPAALRTYRALERDWNTPLLTELSALWLHSTPDEAAHFAARAEEEEGGYLEAGVNPAPYSAFLQLHEAPGRVHPLYRLHSRALLHRTYTALQGEGALLQEMFDWRALRVDADGVHYKGIGASHLICCEGAAAVDNPFFAPLPWATAGGEAIVLSIPGLPRDVVYKFAELTLSPWEGLRADDPSLQRAEDSYWWFGTSYVQSPVEARPTAAFRAKAEAALRAWLKPRFEVVDHLAGIRPATVDRKPFVGLHPRHPRIGILNGLGSKGVLMTPLLAEELTAHLLDGDPLTPGADISRYGRVLMRAGT